MRDVLMTSDERTLATSDSPKRDIHAVIERNCKHDDRHQDSIPRAPKRVTRVVGVDVDRARGQRRQHVADEQRAAITHKNPGGCNVENKKSSKRARE